MIGIIQAIKDKADSRCIMKKRVGRDGCSVSLKGMPASRVIVDFDGSGSPLPANRTRCDYLLVIQDGNELAIVAPLELKSGDLKYSTAVRQLQAGADVAERWIPKNMQVRFRPTVAFGGGVRAADRKSARQGGVRFRGRQVPIRLMKCGGVLMDAVRCPSGG